MGLGLGLGFGFIEGVEEGKWKRQIGRGKVGYGRGK